MIKKNIIEMIGNTDLLYLERISKEYNNNIYAKVEGVNPFGSIKDRVAYNIIKVAMEKKLINKDTVIIEATSGNTGIGLAGVCLYFGLKCIIAMPEHMSKERIQMMKAYKAQVILTKKELGMKGSIEVANQLMKEYPNSYMPSQFENEENPNAHYLSTGVEIYNDLKGMVDLVCSSIGTGGTISGIGKYLKEKNNQIKIIGVEPKESAVINGFKPGLHGIQGIGAGFIPATLDLKVCDEVMMVETKDALKASNEILCQEALFVGISSGACLEGVKQYVKKYGIENKNIVLIFPDSGTKYMKELVEDNE